MQHVCEHTCMPHMRTYIYICESNACSMYVKIHMLHVSHIKTPACVTHQDTCMCHTSRHLHVSHIKTPACVTHQDTCMCHTSRHPYFLGKRYETDFLIKTHVAYGRLWGTATCKIIGSGSTVFNGFWNQLTTRNPLKRLPIVCLQWAVKHHFHAIFFWKRIRWICEYSLIN
jgi:hypothetical protein